MGGASPHMKVMVGVATAASPPPPPPLLSMRLTSIVKE